MTLTPPVDVSRLVTLVRDSRVATNGWRNRAACADIRLGDHYFPDEGESPPVEALARCSTCPVAQECLATALAHEQKDGMRFGWWGGCSPDERQVLAERMALAPTPADVDLCRSAGDLARSMRAQNHTIASIAAEVGCTERTVYRYLASTAA